MLLPIDKMSGGLKIKKTPKNSELNMQDINKNIGKNKAIPVTSLGGL
jgi:hypothetical protein